MTIGYDGSRAFTPHKTGTENYSYQLLNSLIKIDRKNIYKVYIKSFNLDTAVELLKFSENFKVVEINWSRLWTQGGLAIQTFRDELDVLFVPAHTLPVIRKPGLKTVVTVHDLGSEYLPQMHQLKQRIYLGFIQKFQLKSATKIIAVSKATKQDLVEGAGIEADKVEVVYEGYDKENFKFQISNIKYQNDTLANSLRQYGLKLGGYFLFVGTVQPRKNLERVIKAFSVIPANAGIQLNSKDSKLDSRLRGNDNLKLVIVGQKGWLSDDIYRLPPKLGIEDRVRFLGYVPDEKLPALYSGAIALVFPSLFEGFGLPILEAQACGCPVVTSNISSMPEVGGRGAIYVNPYSIEDIIRGMRECQISNVKSQMIKVGFENIKRFSWEKCAKETLKVLEKVVQNPQVYYTSSNLTASI